MGGGEIMTVIKRVIFHFAYARKVLARKEHDCFHCKIPIPAKEEYIQFSYRGFDPPIDWELNQIEGHPLAPWEHLRYHDSCWNSGKIEFPPRILC
jgi:hypothetical protein